MFERHPVAVVLIGWAILLLGTSGAALATLAVRIARTGELHLSFLVFNLFLAWIPVLFALAVFATARSRAPGWVLLGVSAPWLVFLPNAPYLWTDLIHLAGHPRPLFVTDLVVILSFATAGLAVGYASLSLVHAAFERRFGPRVAWSMVAFVLPVTSVGISIGRVLRWNSWEAATRLDELIALVAMRLSDPTGNPGLVAVCTLMTACLAVSYALVFALTRAVLQRGAHLAQVRDTSPIRSHRIHPPRGL
jgi:uncharacterized membrane protein